MGGEDSTTGPAAYLRGGRPVPPRGPRRRRAVRMRPGHGARCASAIAAAGRAYRASYKAVPTMGPRSHARYKPRLLHRHHLLLPQCCGTWNSQCIPGPTQLGRERCAAPPPRTQPSPGQQHSTVGSSSVSLACIFRSSSVSLACIFFHCPRPRPPPPFALSLCVSTAPFLSFAPSVSLPLSSRSLSISLALSLSLALALAPSLSPYYF